MINFGVEQTLDLAVRDLQTGRLAQAEMHCRQILARQPNHADALHLLGNIAYQVGQYDQAIDLLRRALMVHPGAAVCRANLAEVLRVAGRFDEALVEAKQALAALPDSGSLWCTLAKTYIFTERSEEAVAAAQQAVTVAPQHAEAHVTLGTALVRVDRLGEAVEAFQRGHALDPARTPHGNFALALARLGRLDEALAEYQQAIMTTHPPQVAHSSLIYTMLHHPEYGPQRIFQEHLEWARRYAEPLRTTIRPHANDRQSERKLRIGYVSSNFRSQAVCYFFEPILRHHDHQQFTVACYFDSPVSDAVTTRLRAYADIWRVIDGMGDEQLAELVRQDQIDILIDLNGHLPKHRLLAFARKPAPVQVTYIGYQTTTGLAAMDYRITDAVADPPGQTEAWHTEKLVRLPVFFAYRPAPGSPPPRGLPLDRTGRLTLGSMNHYVKINDQVIALWSRILKQLPDACLRVLIPGGPKGNDHVLRAFAHHGIDAARITLEPHRSVTDYLDLFNEIDIALDSFPFAGHTTTCDALWMGVPVITLAGATYPGRMSASVLTCTGLTQWIATTPEQYMQKVLDLARDTDQLRQWHSTLREHFAASPAMDGAAFTRHLEAAYRQMWRDWCAAGRL